MPCALVFFFCLIRAVKWFSISIKVGARAPGFFGVALRVALRLENRSCAAIVEDGDGIPEAFQNTEERKKIASLIRQALIK